MANCEVDGRSMEQLPSALLATIMTKLDVSSICSVASTCKTFNTCASQILSFLPNFNLLDVALSVDLLRHLLPPNPHLSNLKVDCNRLDDSAIEHLIRPSLHELCLQNCVDFSGKLLSEIGRKCKNLRSLHLGAVAEKRGRSIHISDMEDLLTGCTQLETLMLMFDVSVFLLHNFARVWALASPKLTSLEIGYITSISVIELLNPLLIPQNPPNLIRPSILPSIQKLCLSVDYITDPMVATISICLTSLTHLDLRDAPISEPALAFDLTNAGIQHINLNGKLKHLSLVRSQECFITYFDRVNDLGVLFMADRCSNIESICLSGFNRVTDSGFKTILHSCLKLYKLKVSRGMHLTDLVFHDISATSLSLTYVGLRWCNLLTNRAIARLVLNLNLTVLELRHCRNLGDEALKSISTLSKLKVLLLDGCDVSDTGLLHLRRGLIRSLVSLSIRGCKRITDKCISSLFDNSYKLELQKLDLSNLPNLTDNGILSLARSRVPIFELRVRQCPFIGDISVIALASMQVEDDRCHGSSLRVLDLYNCGRITQLTYQWLKKPYFPKLRWLGVTGFVYRDMDALLRNRPFLHMAFRGEELGSERWDETEGLRVHDYEEVDEFEQWLMQGEDEEMEDAENNYEE